MAYVRGQQSMRSRSPRNPRGALEHALVASTMTVGPFALEVVGTMTVGPFALEPRGNIKMGTLRALQHEVSQYTQSPMSVCDLLMHYNRHHDPRVRRVPELSWLECLGEIGRCVAAYANSRDDDERQTLRDTMGGYALDMQCCTVT